MGRAKAAFLCVKCGRMTAEYPNVVCERCRAERAARMQRNCAVGGGREQAQDDGAITRLPLNQRGNV